MSSHEPMPTNFAPKSYGRRQYEIMSRTADKISWGPLLVLTFFPPWGLIHTVEQGGSWTSWSVWTWTSVAGSVFVIYYLCALATTKWGNSVSRERELSSS
jgi:hypothetical protein